MSSFAGMSLGTASGVDSITGYTPINSTDYVVLTTDRLIAFRTLTGPKTVTLPLASTFGAGNIIRINDESGNCRPWTTITIITGEKCQGIVGYGPVLVWPFEGIALQSNGVDSWSVVGRSHPRASFQEIVPRGSFIIEEDCYMVLAGITSNAFIAPYIHAQIGSGGGGGQAYGSITRTGAIYAATAVSGSANDRVYLRTLGPTSLVTGDGIIFCEYTFNINVLPTAGDDFVFVCGFIDSFTNTYSVDGCWWMIDRSVSNNWLCVTSSNSSRTISDSGVPWALNGWKLGVDINSDGTSVDFYNGTTLVRNETTNIPTPSSGARSFGVSSGFYKKAGSASALEIFTLDRVRLFVRNDTQRTN